MNHYPFCASGRHCHNCRNHEPSRQAFAKSYGLKDNFLCPKGLPIGTPVNIHERINRPASVCIYRGKLIQPSSCKCGDGAIWECLHPNMLLPDGSPGRQIGRACGKDKCKGHTAESSNIERNK